MHGYGETHTCYNSVRTTTTTTTTPLQPLQPLQQPQQPQPPQPPQPPQGVVFKLVTLFVVAVNRACTNLAVDMESHVDGARGAAARRRQRRLRAQWRHEKQAVAMALAEASTTALDRRRRRWWSGARGQRERSARRTTPYGDRSDLSQGRGQRHCLWWLGRMGDPRRQLESQLECLPWCRWPCRRPSRGWTRQLSPSSFSALWRTRGRRSRRRRRRRIW